jgi:hypothetical protein
MKREPAALSQQKSPWPWGILAAGLTLRLIVAWLPIELLVQKTLPDDACYYFLIARNVIQGHGVSVDGVVPTNGFHPLWAITLLLPYALASGDLAIHLGLTLAAIFDILAAWLGYRTVKELTGDERGAALTALLYGFNPLAIMESANGLETALATCMFALCSYWYLVRVRGRWAIEETGFLGKTRFLKSCLLLGVIGGLMVLARTDMVFLLVVIGCDWLWLRRREAIGPLALAAAVVALVVTPWFLWNWLTLGTVVQSSGVAAPYIIRYSILTALRQGAPLDQVWSQRFWPILYLGLLLFWRYTGSAWVLLLLSSIAWRLVNITFKHSNVQTLQSAHPVKNQETGFLGETRFLKDWPLFIPFLGAALPLLVHQFVRWYPRGWYYVPLALATALLVGPLLAKAARRNRVSSEKPGFSEGWLVAGAVLLLALQGVREWGAGFYPWQIHMYRAAHWTAANIPAEVTIGAFNAGFQGLYSGHTVVNLDGVTGQEALYAIANRRLLSYINKRDVRYLVDYQAYIMDSFYPFFEQGFEQHLRQIATLSPDYPPYGALVVYEVLSMQ